MIPTTALSSRPTNAFTLVEILIVVVILGILAAIAVPKFSNASQIARENSLKEDLRMLRTQVGVYKANHADTPPGYPNGDTTQNPTPQAFSDQLTQFTDGVGNTSATGSATFKYGVYLNQVPANPLNGLATVKIIGDADPLTADNTTGWLFQPSTGLLQPNLTGADSDSKNFSDY
jgi:general secretion pathway protein G